MALLGVIKCGSQEEVTFKLNLLKSIGVSRGSKSEAEEDSRKSGFVIGK